MACVNVGVYQDKPASTLPALQKKAGKNVKTVSTYLTVGHALDPKLDQARAQEARRQAAHQLAARRGQRHAPRPRLPAQRRSPRASSTADLKALGKQIKALPHGAIVRPMPDPNTPWYAWSGTVNGNRPGDYVKAWKHVRKVLTQGRGQEGQAALERLRAQRAGRQEERAQACTSRAPSRSTWSAPTPTTSATPRASTWTAPGRPVRAGLRRRSRSSRKKPFWISETGSTARGGDEGAWIGALGQLRQDHAEARRSRLVRRQGQHRRLPRAAHGCGRSRVQGVRRGACK